MAATLTDLQVVLDELATNVAQNSVDIQDLIAKIGTGGTAEDLQPAVDAVKNAVIALQDAHSAAQAALNPPA